MPSSDGLTMTMKEASQRLGISLDTLQQLIAENAIRRTEMPNREWGIRECEIERYVMGPPMKAYEEQ